MRKIVLFILFFFLIGLLLPHFAFGQTLSSPTTDLRNVGVNSGLPTNDFKEVIFSIVKIIFRAIGIILFLQIFYAGFVWMFSMGNDEKVDEAKKIISQSIVGLVLIIITNGTVIFLITTLTNVLTPETSTRI